MPPLSQSNSSLSPHPFVFHFYSITDRHTRKGIPWSRYSTAYSLFSHPAEWIRLIDLVQKSLLFFILFWVSLTIRCAVLSTRIDGIRRDLAAVICLIQTIRLTSKFTSWIKLCLHYSQNGAKQKRRFHFHPLMRNIKKTHWNPPDPRTRPFSYSRKAFIPALLWNVFSIQPIHVLSLYRESFLYIWGSHHHFLFKKGKRQRNKGI